MLRLISSGFTHPVDYRSRGTLAVDRDRDTLTTVRTTIVLLIEKEDVLVMRLAKPQSQEKSSYVGVECNNLSNAI
jgi:hypothetical protein